MPGQKGRACGCAVSALVCAWVLISCESAAPPRPLKTEVAPPTEPAPVVTPGTGVDVPDTSGPAPSEGGTPEGSSNVPPADGGMPPADGGVPPADGGVPPAGDPSQYCQQLIQTLAEHHSSCKGGTVGAWTEWLRWESRESLYCREGVRAVSQQRAVFNPDLAATCLSQLTDSACGDALDDALSAPGGACRQAITGRLPEGQACHANAECVKGSFCNFFRPGTEGTVVPGTCTRFTPPGGDCYWTECDYPYACEPQRSGAWTCDYVERKLGEQCHEYGHCRNGYCRVTYENPQRPGEYQGVCEAYTPAATCQWDRDCDPRLYCVPGLRQCQPRKAPGASCQGGSSASPRECEQFTECDAASLTCVRKVLVGEACDAYRSSPCLTGSCQRESGGSRYGVCQPRAEPGAVP
jgi:hypothetical protein